MAIAVAHLLARNAGSVTDVALHRRGEVVALRRDLPDRLIDLRSRQRIVGFNPDLTLNARPC